MWSLIEPAGTQDKESEDLNRPEAETTRQGGVFNISIAAQGR